MRSTRVALALLVVLAPILGVVAVQPAAAQTYSHTFEGVGETRFVGFDVEGASGATVTVEVSTTDGVGGQNVTLYREDKSVSRLQKGTSVTVVENAGAYDDLTIKIKGLSEAPDWGVGGDFGEVEFRARDQLFTTGGDRDLLPTTGDHLSMMVNPAVTNIDVTGVPDATALNGSDVDGLNAAQKKVEIYQTAAASGDQAATFHTMLDNRLQDTQTVALLHGKTSYVRELNVGGSETASKSAAKQNISEYYSVMQRNLITEWNQQIDLADHLSQMAANQSGLEKQYIGVMVNSSSSGGDVTGANGTVQSVGTEQMTLANGTVVDVKTIDIEVEPITSDDSTDRTEVVTFRLAQGQVNDITSSGGADQPDVKAISAGPVNDLDETAFVEFNDYASSWSAMESQNTNAQNQMETVVNQTYSQYEAGAINSSDLVDPYMLQSHFSPGSEFESWSAATLALLGTNQPTDMESTGYMNVTLNDGSELQGIVHAPHNPTSTVNGSTVSEKFQVGETYYPSNFSGPVYVTTDSQIQEVTQPFTLDNITTFDGEHRTNFTVVEKNYSTTSAEDLEKINDQLAQLRAELEAREQKSAGGGPIFGSGSGSLMPLVLVAGGLALIIYQNGNNGNNNGGSRRSSNGGGRSRRRY